jgi:hypothetical protein
VSLGAPKSTTKSCAVATVVGTNAGPLTDVPITPAGVPLGAIFVGPVRLIMRAETPADLYFNSAILLPYCSSKSLKLTILNIE